MAPGSHRVDVGTSDAAFQLLLACARVELEPGQRDQIGALLAAPLDWQRLYALADKHGLRPFVFHHLCEGRLGPVPGEIEARLWRHSEQLRLRNATMETELLALLSLLRAAGIPAVAHKGPVVAHRAYGRPDLREYGDLDLLMPLATIRQARELLESLGYLPKYPMSPAAESALLASRRQYHLMLAHREHGMLVELHWRTDGDYVAERSDAPEWWRRLPGIDIRGTSVPCLPMDEFLLALCLHGSKHYWESLHWLVDVAELLRPAPSEAWNALKERAVHLGAGRRLALGLRLARDQLGVGLPPELDEWVDASKPVEAFAAGISARWPRLDAAPHSAKERMLLDFRLCDRASQRFRHFARTMFLPGVKEWSRWPLPRPLHFLYVPLRVVVLVGSRVRRA